MFIAHIPARHTRSTVTRTADVHRPTVLTLGTLREVVAVKATVELGLIGAVAMFVAFTLHGTVRSDVAEVTVADVGKYATPVLTSLATDRLTDTPVIACVAWLAVANKAVVGVGTVFVQRAVVMSVCTLVFRRTSTECPRVWRT